MMMAVTIAAEKGLSSVNYVDDKRYEIIPNQQRFNDYNVLCKGVKGVNKPKGVI